MLCCDEEFSPEHTCPSCTDTRYNLQDCREFVGEIVKLLYSDEALNKSQLESCLEELCDKLDLKYPGGEVKIARYKRSPAMIEMWKDYNNQ